MDGRFLVHLHIDVMKNVHIHVAAWNDEHQLLQSWPAQPSPPHPRLDSEGLGDGWFDPTDWGMFLNLSSQLRL